MKRFAFIMDPLEKLDLPWDTSLCLLRELANRGHETYLLTPNVLFSTGNSVKGNGSRVHPLGHHRYQLSPSKNFNLAHFDAVWIRKDPPFDSGYLALTYLLEPVARKTYVINHPRGIRNANEKLFVFQFPSYAPASIVSAHPDKILEFQKKLGTDLVIKPLYEKGGKGVFLLKQKRRGNHALLEKATRGGKEVVVAQKFVPVSRGRGDKRILLWRGEILGAFERIPKAGEFRSNLSLGGRFVRTPVTEREKRIVRELRPVLLKEGLLFVGIDTRGGKLIEVNVTSPAGLVELDRLYGGRATKKMADEIEKI